MYLIIEENETNVPTGDFQLPGQILEEVPSKAVEKMAESPEGLVSKAASMPTQPTQEPIEMEIKEKDIHETSTETMAFEENVTGPSITTEIPTNTSRSNISLAN